MTYGFRRSQGGGNCSGQPLFWLKDSHFTRQLQTVESSTTSGVGRMHHCETTILLCPAIPRDGEGILFRFTEPSKHCMTQRGTGRNLRRRSDDGVDSTFSIVTHHKLLWDRNDVFAELSTAIASFFLFHV